MKRVPVEHVVGFLLFAFVGFCVGFSPSYWFPPPPKVSACQEVLRTNAYLRVNVKLSGLPDRIGAADTEALLCDCQRSPFSPAVEEQSLWDSLRNRWYTAMPNRLAFCLGSYRLGRSRE